jgi:hypothetical protein
MKFKNIKTKVIYTHKGHCINATNANDGQLMILYEASNGDLFAREASEFNSKFEPVNK